MTNLELVLLHDLYGAHVNKNDFNSSILACLDYEDGYKDIPIDSIYLNPFKYLVEEGIQYHPIVNNYENNKHPYGLRVKGYLTASNDKTKIAFTANQFSIQESSYCHRTFNNSGIETLQFNLVLANNTKYKYTITDIEFLGGIIHSTGGEFEYSSFIFHAINLDENNEIKFLPFGTNTLPITITLNSIEKENVPSNLQVLANHILFNNYTQVTESPQILKEIIEIGKIQNLGFFTATNGNLIQPTLGISVLGAKDLFDLSESEMNALKEGMKNKTITNLTYINPFNVFVKNNEVTLFKGTENYEQSLIQEVEAEDYYGFAFFDQNNNIINSASIELKWQDDDQLFSPTYSGSVSTNDMTLISGPLHQEFLIKNIGETAITIQTIKLLGNLALNTGLIPIVLDSKTESVAHTIHPGEIITFSYTFELNGTTVNTSIEN